MTIATETVRRRRQRPLLVGLSHQQMVQPQSAGGIRREQTHLRNLRRLRAKQGGGKQIAERKEGRRGVRE